MWMNRSPVWICIELSWSKTISIDLQSILLQMPFANFLGFRRGHHNPPVFLPAPSIPVYLQSNAFTQSVFSESDRAAIVEGQRFRRERVSEESFSMTREGRQTHNLKDFHICLIHPKGENHILSGKSDTLANLLWHLCLKPPSEKELRNWHVQRKAPSIALLKLMSWSPLLRKTSALFPMSLTASVSKWSILSVRSWLYRHQANEFKPSAGVKTAPSSMKDASYQLQKKTFTTRPNAPIAQVGCSNNCWSWREETWPSKGIILWLTPTPFSSDLMSFSSMGKPFFTAVTGVVPSIFVPIGN